MNKHTESHLENSLFAPNHQGEEREPEVQRIGTRGIHKDPSRIPDGAEEESFVVPGERFYSRVRRLEPFFRVLWREPSVPPEGEEASMPSRDKTLRRPGRKRSRHLPTPWGRSHWGHLKKRLRKVADHDRTFHLISRLFRRAVPKLDRPELRPRPRARTSTMQTPPSETNKLEHLTAAAERRKKDSRVVAHVLSRVLNDEFLFHREEDVLRRPVLVQMLLLSMEREVRTDRQSSFSGTSILPFSLFDVARFFSVGSGYSVAKRKKARVEVELVCKTGKDRRLLWRNRRFRNRLKLVERLRATGRAINNAFKRAPTPGRKRLTTKPRPRVPEHLKSNLSSSPTYAPGDILKLPNKRSWFRLLLSVLLNKVCSRRNPQKRGIRKTRSTSKASLRKRTGGARRRRPGVKCYRALSAWGLYLRRKVFPGRGVLRASTKVNRKGLTDYFYGEPSKVRSALAPVVEVLWFVGPRTRRFLSRCRFSVVAHGGGLQGQADACCLGLAKALVEHFRRWDAVLRLTVCCWTHWTPRNTGRLGSLNVQKRVMETLFSRSLSGYLDCRDLKPILKERGMLRSDPRVKERKKFGLKGARRASQYSKR